MSLYFPTSRAITDTIKHDYTIIENISKDIQNKLVTPVISLDSEGYENFSICSQVIETEVKLENQDLKPVLQDYVSIADCYNSRVPKGSGKFGELELFVNHSINAVNNYLQLNCGCDFEYKPDATDKTARGTDSRNDLTWLPDNINTIEHERSNTETDNDSNLSNVSSIRSQNKIKSFEFILYGQEAMPEPENKLKNSYYLDKFEEILSTVLKNEHHLFCPRELQMFKSYMNLGINARYLFIRLFLRKHSWIPVSAISYNDLDLPSALIELCKMDNANSISTCSIKNKEGLIAADLECNGLLPLAIDEKMLDNLESICENLSVTQLKSLGKECGIPINAKSTRVEIIKSIIKNSKKQTVLGFYKKGENDENNEIENRIITKAKSLLGKAIKLNPASINLIKRLHILYERTPIIQPESTMQLAILSSIGKINFPEYKVTRNKNIFISRKASIYYFKFLQIENQIDSLSVSVPAGDIESWKKVWKASNPYVLFWGKLLGARFIREIECEEMQCSDSRHSDSERDFFEDSFLLDMGIPYFGLDHLHRKLEFELPGSNPQDSTKTKRGYNPKDSKPPQFVVDQQCSIDDRFEYWRRRFTACWVLTRIAEKSLRALAALGLYLEESIILHTLIDQQWFKTNYVGRWYRRLMLVQMNYLTGPKKAPANHASNDSQAAAQRDEANFNEEYINNLFICRETCIKALLNPKLSIFDVIHVEKRLATIDKRIGIPEHLQLKLSRKILSEPKAITIYGIKAASVKKKATSARLGWIGIDGECCSVEQVAVSYYTENRGMVAVHSESSILTSIFGLLFWDIIFYPIEGVFDTEFQTKPLDMHTDSFYLSRKKLIDQRIEEIRNGDSIGLIHSVYNREYQRQTSTIGINWEYSDSDLYNLCTCLGPVALAEICLYIATDYKAHSSGVPDICAWNVLKNEAVFAEVKGPGDTLSETQKGWIDVLISSSVAVELCLVREHSEAEKPYKKPKR